METRDARGPFSPPVRTFSSFRAPGSPGSPPCGRGLPSRRSRRHRARGRQPLCARPSTSCECRHRSGYEASGYVNQRRVARHVIASRRPRPFARSRSIRTLSGFNRHAFYHWAKGAFLMHERAVSERHGAMIRRAFRPALPLGFRIDAVDDRVVSTAGSGWLRTQETRLESGRNKS